jgi:diguanylate cyclase (GGDEF)-like protein
MVHDMIADAFGAIAYIAMAFVVRDLFAATGSSVERRQLRVVTAVLATGAMLQIFLGVTWYFSQPALAQALDILAGSCLLAVPVSFGPVVMRLKQGRLRITNLRLAQSAQRLEAAEARVLEANMVAFQANAALKEITMEDGLTGLANRRRFDLNLVQEFKRAVRSNLPLGVVLIGLDHFQAYNERYGRAAGDECLWRVAEAIKAIPRRPGDVLARYGGEEIAVLLPLADENGAARVAAVLLETVQVLRMEHEGSETGFVTISCGTAAFTGLQGLNNPFELVRRADRALYMAKNEGRNRVRKFDLSMNLDLQDPYGPPVVQDLEWLAKVISPKMRMF